MGGSRHTVLHSLCLCRPPLIFVTSVHILRVRITVSFGATIIIIYSTWLVFNIFLSVLATFFVIITVIIIIIIIIKIIIIINGYGRAWGPMSCTESPLSIWLPRPSNIVPPLYLSVQFMHVRTIKLKSHTQTHGRTDTQTHRSNIVPLFLSVQWTHHQFKRHRHMYTYTQTVWDSPTM